MATKIKLRRLLALHLTGPIAKPFQNNEIGIQKSKNPFADKLLDREIEIGSREEAEILIYIESFNTRYIDNSQRETFNLDQTIRDLFKQLQIPINFQDTIIDDFLSEFSQHEQGNLSSNEDDELIPLNDGEDDLLTSAQTKLNDELKQIAIERQRRIFKVLKQLLNPELPPVREINIDNSKIELGYLSEAEFSDFLMNVFLDPTITEADRNNFITKKGLEGILTLEELKAANDNKPIDTNEIKERIRDLNILDKKEQEQLTKTIENNIAFSKLLKKFEDNIFITELLKKFKKDILTKIASTPGFNPENLANEFSSTDKLNLMVAFLKRLGIPDEKLSNPVNIQLNEPLVSNRHRAIYQITRRESSQNEIIALLAQLQIQDNGDNVAKEIYAQNKFKQLIELIDKDYIRTILQNEKETIKNQIKNNPGLDINSLITYLNNTNIDLTAITNAIFDLRGLTRPDAVNFAKTIYANNQLHILLTDANIPKYIKTVIVNQRNPIIQKTLIAEPMLTANELKVHALNLRFDSTAEETTTALEALGINNHDIVDAMLTIKKTNIEKVEIENNLRTLGIDQNELGKLAEEIYIRNTRKFIKTKLSTDDNRIKLLNIIQLVDEPNVHLDSVLKGKSLGEIDDFINELTAITINTSKADIQNTIKNFFGENSQFYKTQGENLAIDIFVSQKLNKLKNENKPLFEALNTNKVAIRNSIKNGLDFSREIEQLKQPSVSIEKLQRVFSNTNAQQIRSIYGINQYSFLIQQLTNRIPKSLDNYLKNNKDNIVNALTSLDHSDIKTQIAVLTNHIKTAEEVKQAFQRLTGNPSQENLQLLEHFHKAKQKLVESLQYFTNGRPIFKRWLEQVDNKLWEFDTIEKFTNAENALAILTNVNSQNNPDIENALKNIGIAHEEENAKLVIAENRLFILLRNGTLRADIKALFEQNFDNMVKKIAGVDYDFIQGNFAQITQAQNKLPNLIQALREVGIPEPLIKKEAKKIYATNQLGNLNTLPSYIQALLNIAEVKNKFSAISNDDELKTLNSHLENLTKSSNITILKESLIGIGLEETEAKRNAELFATLHNPDATKLSIQASLEALKVEQPEKEAALMYGKKQLEKLQKHVQTAAQGTIDELVKNFINEKSREEQIVKVLSNINPSDTIINLFKHLLAPNIDSKNKSTQLNTLFARVTGSSDLEKSIDSRQKYHQLLRACNDNTAPELKKLLDTENAKNQIEAHFDTHKAISVTELLNGLSEIKEIKKKAIIKAGEPPVDTETETTDKDATTKLIKQFLIQQLGLSGETIDNSKADLMVLKNEGKNYLPEVKYQSLLSDISDELVELKHLLQQPDKKAKILIALGKDNLEPFPKIIGEIENAVTVEKLITALGKIGLSTDELGDESIVNTITTEIRKASFKKSSVAQRSEVINLINAIPINTFSPPAPVQKYQTLFTQLTSDNSNVNIVYEAYNGLKQVNDNDLANDQSLAEKQIKDALSFYAKNIIHWLNQEANLPPAIKNILKKHSEKIENFIINTTSNDIRNSIKNSREPGYWKRKLNQLAEASSINAVKTCLNELGIDSETFSNDELKTILKTNQKDTTNNHVDYLKKKAPILASIITSNLNLIESFIETTSVWEAPDFAIRLKRLETQLRHSGNEDLYSVLCTAPNGIIKEAHFNLLTSEQKSIVISNAYLESLRESAPSLYHWLTLVPERHDIAAKLFSSQQKIESLLNEIKTANNPDKLRLILTRELSSLSLTDKDLPDENAKQIIGEQRIPLLLKQWLLQSNHWNNIAKQFGSVTATQANQDSHNFIANLANLDKPNLNTITVELNKILPRPGTAAGLASKGEISQDDASLLWQTSKLFSPFLALENASSQIEIKNQLDAIQVSLKNFRPFWRENIKKKKDSVTTIDQALNEIQLTGSRLDSQQNIQKLENLERMLSVVLEKLRHEQQEYQALKNILETKVDANEGRTAKTQLVDMLKQTDEVITHYESLLDKTSEKLSEYRMFLKNQALEDIKNIAISGGFKVEVFNNNVSLDEKNKWVERVTSNTGHAGLGGSSVVIDSVEQRKSVSLDSSNERVYYAKSINNMGVLVLSQNNQNTRLETLPLPKNPLERKQALQETAINFFLSCLQRDKQNGKMIHTFKGKADKKGLTLADIKYVYSLIYALNLNTRGNSLVLINDSDFQTSHDKNFQKFATQNLTEAKKYLVAYGIANNTTTSSIKEALNAAKELNQPSTFSPRR